MLECLIQTLLFQQAPIQAVILPHPLTFPVTLIGRSLSGGGLFLSPLLAAGLNDNLPVVMMRFHRSVRTFPNEPIIKDPTPSHGLCIPTEQHLTLFECFCIYFIPAHTHMAFDHADSAPSELRSIRFCPPHCTGFDRHGWWECRYCRSKYLPKAGTSSLLRIHLPPHSRNKLESPLDQCVLSPRSLQGFPG